MQKRGRKSAASLETSIINVTGVMARPDAPYDLTDEEVDEWRAVVSRMPADWFGRETHGLLTQYCRHIAAARRISQLIRQCEKAELFDLEDFNKLLIMQERESRCLSSLATRMRISQQSHFDKTKPRPIVGQRPWEGCDVGPIR